MAVLDIVLYPDDPLTGVAEPYSEIGPEVAKLASDMLETTHAHQGVGLAGPQVGLLKQIVVVREPEKEPLCLVNAEIVESDGRELGEEGCLSLPHLFAMVPRATFIRVRGMDERGNPLDFEARDFLARVIQHELDHLKGVMFVDRLDVLTRQDKLEEWAAIRARLMEGSLADVGRRPVISTPC